MATNVVVGSLIVKLDYEGDATLFVNLNRMTHLRLGKDEAVLYGDGLPSLPLDSAKLKIVLDALYGIPPKEEKEEK